jgi:c-di-GMP-binding flagellar brake protein YcgR
MLTKPENKRRFPRIGVHSPIRYQILGTPEFSNSIADNISVGGLSFINNRFIKPATNLNLEINILSRVLNSTGRITWVSNLPHSDRYKMGVEFTNLDGREKKYISDYIDMYLERL